MTRIALIGECMIELSHVGERRLALAFGGDALNTAVYLARRGRPDGLEVDFVTRLGEDGYSEAMIAEWRDERIGTALVDRLPGRAAGLYVIHLDRDGERSFTYYRSESAARELLADDDHAGRVRDGLAGADWVFLSGVTLSLLGEAAHRRMMELLDDLRAGGAAVALDTNYRASAWPDRETAAARIAAALERCDLALPTLDDDRELFGDRDVEACLARLASAGVPEVAVKLDADGACVARDGEARHVPAVAGVEVVDTTGAGDAFDAGYLHARLTGHDPVAAATAGNRLAASVIAHRGAIVPADVLPPAPSPRTAGLGQRA